MRQEKRNKNDWNLFICPSAFCLFSISSAAWSSIHRLFFLFLFFFSSFHKSTVFVRFVCHPPFFLENLYLLLAAGPVDPLAGRWLLSMKSPPGSGFLNAKSLARPAARVNVQHTCKYAVRTVVYSTSTAAAAVCVWNVTLFTSAILQSISLLFPPADILTV